MRIHLTILKPLLTLVAVCMYTGGICQLANVPAVVTDNFNSMFKDAKKIQWGGDQSSDFHVYFFMDSAQCEAKFSADGKWISTEMKISEDSLPLEIKNTLRSNSYANWI